ncbi:MAG: CHAT domain-containing protein [Spirochaetaceae bacterium]|jgi:CHAT domain-containing protein/Flp pilus assembly protein TadD|nr:CHAT domain-containing protein [Spirochaetaceae bacterium]
MKKLVVLLFAVLITSCAIMESVRIHDQGIAHYNAGDYDSAIADYTQAIALEPKDYYAYNNRGLAYVAKGELDRAIADYTQAIALNPKYDAAYNNRGIAYAAKGELDRAITDYTRAIKLNSKLEQIYNNRGNAYAAKGELDRAITDYNQAITLNPKDDHAYNNRGNVYKEKGELDRAITDYNQAITLNPDSVFAYNNRGNAYAAKGELDRAIADYTQAITLNPKDDYVYNSRGSAYARKGEPDKAIADFTRAAIAADGSASILDIFFRSWEYTGTVYKTYPFLGAALDANAFDRRMADVARETLVLSIAKAEKVRAELGSRGAALMAGMVYQYYASLDFEARFGSSERAFAVSEGLRSRGFLEQMGTEAALRLPGIAPADARRVRELTENIGNLQELLGKLTPQADEARYAQAGQALTRAEEELAALDKSITEKVPRYASLRYPKTAALSEAQAFCGEDTAILEFAIWDASVEFTPPATASSQSTYKERPSINSYCLVITRDGLTPVTLDNSFNYAGTVKALVSKIHHTDSYGNILLLPQIAFEEERNALYDALIKPVLKSIPAGVKRLLIVPDGELAFLPFDILRENPQSPELGTSYRISLSPSVSVSILAAQADKVRAEPVLAFGGAWYDKGKTIAERTRGVTRGEPEEAGAITPSFDSAGEYYKNRLVWQDIPGTETEARAIGNIASKSTLVLGRETSEEKVKKLSADGTLEKSPILHFACHGYFNGTYPELSAIVFSEVSGLLPESAEDGYLTVAEAALLRLNAQAVILSACDTGRGGLKRGDGMVGLVRSLMVAGSRSAGVSLWPISDEAAVEFMEGVYRRVLREGKSFREAYYEVKQEFRNGDWSHPFYWAPFTLYE